MLNLTLTGDIIYLYPTFIHDNPSYGPSNSSIVNKSFSYQKIIINSSGQEYTLTFLNDRIELIKYCKIGMTIQAKVILRGRKWVFKGKTYSVNEFVVTSVNIIKYSRFNSLITFKDNIYNIERIYDDTILKLSLINIKDKTKIELGGNHVFPDKRLNKNHILIPESIDLNLIYHLQNLGILIVTNKIVTLEGISGFICKILILDLFKNRKLLFSKSEERQYLSKLADDDCYQIDENAVKNSFIHSENSSSFDYEEAERLYFDAMTDGQLGTYDDYFPNNDLY